MFQISPQLLTEKSKITFSNATAFKENDHLLLKEKGSLRNIAKTLRPEDRGDKFSIGINAVVSPR